MRMFECELFEKNQNKKIIEELKKATIILTNVIYEETKNETDFNVLNLLEEIVTKFYDKINKRIKELSQK